MNDLPDELLCTIFKYTIRDIHQLIELQLVCKRFYQLSNNGYLWYYTYKKIYPHWSFGIPYANLKQPCIDWKSYVLKLYKQKNQIEREGFKLEPIILDNNNYSKIQEPFVSDIDPITNKGVIAISTKKITNNYEILFYSYPKYELIRKFKLLFEKDNNNEWSCQIIGLQTINKKRIFAISITQPTQENTTIWKNILIYQLNSNGTTNCLSHLESNNLFLGRGIWFFSNLKNHLGNDITKDWLQIISPDTITNDKSPTLFMLAYGLSLSRFAGYSQIIRFNLLPIHDSLDPSKTVYKWDQELDRFTIATNNDNHIISTNQYSKIISTFYLGGRVSCMIHFNSLNELNHLIVTGNFLRDELSIYDWRFGVKVGIFPNTDRSNSVQPWGFEFGWSIPPPPSRQVDYINYGPRLLVVGDSQDKFQIKVWDISFLLKVKWDPFDHLSVTHMHDPSTFYISWWSRGTNALKSIVMEYEENLPYNISLHDVKRVHLLSTGVNYIAYINLNTWLYLLHDDGYLSIMDIESGQILSTVSTQGIAQDVNIMNEKTLVVTRDDCLLQTLLP